MGTGKDDLPTSGGGCNKGMGPGGRPNSSLGNFSIGEWCTALVGSLVVVELLIRSIGGGGYIPELECLPPDASKIKAYAYYIFSISFELLTILLSLSQYEYMTVRIGQVATHHSKNGTSYEKEQIMK